MSECTSPQSVTPMLARSIGRISPFIQAAPLDQSVIKLSPCRLDPAAKRQAGRASSARLSVSTQAERALFPRPCFDDIPRGGCRNSGFRSRVPADDPSALARPGSFDATASARTGSALLDRAQIAGLRKPRFSGRAALLWVRSSVPEQPSGNRRQKLADFDRRLAEARDRGKKPESRRREDLTAASMAWRMVIELVMSIMIGGAMGW